MQFLTPTTLAVAAALTIPPLIALYFLKLKRRDYPISSTLLWRKAIEDLHVNAPFQKLRSSLLLLLQLLVLILGALALGQPMLARAKKHQKTVILMIDQSASMAVVEEKGRTRLDLAKQEAKRVIDALEEDSRAMVIAFCDRATMVSSFDTDREALRRKIDTIEQTESVSTLGEAVTLAEAYSQSLIIGGAVEGSDVAPESAAPPASVILFTDGRIEDAGTLSPQRLDLSDLEVVRIGRRNDNVGIVAMDARRNYEAPEILQIFATVRNFGESPASFDASLLINGEHMDVQSVELAGGATAGAPMDDGSVAPADQESEDGSAPPGSVASIAFDQVEYQEGGVVEVRLTVGDALSSDNRAWMVIQPPRQADVLLVTEGNHILEKTLSLLNVRLRTMTPDQYEQAPDDDLKDQARSRYDVVVLDRHATGKLFAGNYMFWGCAPIVDGYETLGWIDDEIIIDWDETHPTLRHARIGSAAVDGWERIKVPPDAKVLAEGQTQDSNVLSYLTRGASRYLVCAFSIIRLDPELGKVVPVTDWFLRDDFGLFVFDSVEFLASSTSTGQLLSLLPGEPAMVGVPAGTREVTVERPDGTRDTLPTAGGQWVTYARTRRVGLYRVDAALPEQRTFTVNLYSANESCVGPRETLVVGASPVTATAGESLVNEPLWRWAVLALLLVLVLEWIVYNKRVFV